nr:unnamed protein product [Digitaria exilis]
MQKLHASTDSPDQIKPNRTLQNRKRTRNQQTRSEAAVAPPIQPHRQETNGTAPTARTETPTQPIRSNRDEIIKQQARKGGDGEGEAPDSDMDTEDDMPPLPAPPSPMGSEATANNLDDF